MPDKFDPQPHLDPEDWHEFRRESHRALDEMIDHVRNIRSARSGNRRRPKCFSSSSRHCRTGRAAWARF